MESIHAVCTSLSLLLSKGDIGGIWRAVTPDVQFFVVFILEKVYYSILTLLAIVGAIWLIRKKNYYSLVLTVPIIYFSALVGPVANARYRYPIEPYILILAVWTIYQLYKIRANKKAR